MILTEIHYTTAIEIVTIISDRASHESRNKGNLLWLDPEPRITGAYCWIHPGKLLNPSIGESAF